MVIGTPTVLNLIPGGVMPVIMINETDKGYQKEFLIYNGNAPYNVPANVSATIRGTKRDGLGVTEAATVTAGSNVVRITITEQMTAVPGKNIFELVFVDTNGLRVATTNFIMLVERSALNANTVISESDIAYSEQVLNQLQSVAAFKEQLDNQEIAKIQRFDTVAQMQANPDLKEGMYARTGGYYAVNDGGAALYRIRNTVSSAHYEALSNGLYAAFIAEGAVRPEQFGAKGDGTTDDSSAFQSALNYPLVLLGKNYLIKNVLFRSNTEIFGSGTIIQNGNTTSTRISETSNISNLTVRDITFISGTESNANQDAGCIVFTDCTKITFENVKITNNARRFLTFVRCDYVNVVGFAAKDSKGTVLTAVNSNYATFAHGTITQGTGAFTAHAIDMYAKMGATVTNASIHHCSVTGNWDTGIQITANQTDGGKYNDFIFADNVAVGCATAFKQDGIASCHFENCRCYGCTTNFSNNGISTINCDEFVITNCYAKSVGVNATTGLWQAYPGTKVLIADGCEIENYKCPIRTDNQILRIIMRNCKIHSTGNFKFFREATDVMDRIDFIGNTVTYDGTFSDIASDPFTPCDTLVMRDNVFNFTGLSDPGNVLDFAVTEFFIFSGNTFVGIMNPKFRSNKPQGRSDSTKTCTVIYYGNVRMNDTPSIEMIELQLTEHVTRAITYQIGV